MNRATSRFLKLQALHQQRDTRYRRALLAETKQKTIGAQRRALSSRLHRELKERCPELLQPHTIQGKKGPLTFSSKVRFIAAKHRDPELQRLLEQWRQLGESIDALVAEIVRLDSVIEKHDRASASVCTSWEHVDSADALIRLFKEPHLCSDDVTNEKPSVPTRLRSREPPLLAA